MNEPKKGKYRYWLPFLLEDLPVGANFKPGVLHITFITWFVADLPEEELIDSFYETFSGRQAFDIKIGRDLHLGPHEDVSVVSVEPTSQTLQLHADGLNWFEKIEARWAVKNPYMGDEFIPHIRRRSDTNLKIGDIMKINSLSLVKALRRPDDVREVAAKVLFNEG
jgi:hypothetical protein